MDKLLYLISVITMSFVLLLGCETPVESLAETALLEESKSSALEVTGINNERGRSRIIHGIVDGSGNIVTGSGFTVSIVGPFPNTYKVMFDIPFKSQPTITATAIGASSVSFAISAWIATNNFSPSHFTCTLNTSPPTSDGFSFTVIGTCLECD